LKGHRAGGQASAFCRSSMHPAPGRDRLPSSFWRSRW
jgi:hypothetical protein